MCHNNNVCLKNVQYPVQFNWRFMDTIGMTKASDGIPDYQRSWINTTSLLVLLLCLIEIYQRTLSLCTHENTTKKAGFFKSECKGNAKFANHKTFSKKNLEKKEKKKRIKKINEEKEKAHYYIYREKEKKDEGDTFRIKIGHCDGEGWN